MTWQLSRALTETGMLALALTACGAPGQPMRTAIEAERFSESPRSTPAGDRFTEPQSAPDPTDPLPGAPEPGFRLSKLAVPGFLDAVVATPSTESRLPVLVSTHGAGGDPEWTCNEWGNRVQGRAIVLCPRGKAISARDPFGFYYPDHIVLEKEVLAAVGALKARLESRVRTAPMLYAGYSQGASMGVLFLPAHAHDFPSLVLTEGGFAGWTRASADRFKAAGGRRVLFVCGGGGCRDRAQASARLLDAAGVEARVEYVPGGGHTDAGSVGERLDAVYRWTLAEAE